MKQDVHERAQQLTDAASVEGIAERHRRWLEAHLRSCASCADYAAATERAIQAFRSIAVPTDSQLVRRTQREARRRAQAMRLHEKEMWPVWVSGGLSALVTTVSVALFWVGSEWLAPLAGAPVGLLMAGLVVFWFIPSLAATGIVLRSGP